MADPKGYSMTLKSLGWNMNRKEDWCNSRQNDMKYALVMEVGMLMICFIPISIKSTNGWTQKCAYEGSWRLSFAYLQNFLTKRMGPTPGTFLDQPLLHIYNLVYKLSAINIHIPPYNISLAYLCETGSCSSEGGGHLITP